MKVPDRGYAVGWDHDHEILGTYLLLQACSFRYGLAPKKEM